MTERTVSEIRDDIIVFLDDPHTKKEVMEEIDASDDIIELIMLQLARDGRIAIAPGSNATRWQVRSRVKQKLAAMDGDAE